MTERVALPGGQGRVRRDSAARAYRARSITGAADEPPLRAGLLVRRRGCGCPGVRAGWDPLLGAVRRRAARRGHRGGVQGGDVGVGPLGRAGAVGPPGVDRDGDPVAGDDRQRRAAGPVGHRHRGAGKLRWQRVPVPAVVHQRLRGGLPGHGDDHDGRVLRDRAEPLGGGEISDGATVPVRADPLALVGDPLAEPVQQRLGLRGGDVVGQRPPPALRDRVVRLLHDAFAVPPARRARPDPDPEVLRDRRVRGGDLPGRGVHDGGHPVEPPVPGQPAEPERDLVLGVGQVRLFHRFTQHPTPLAGVRQRPHQQVCLLAVPVPTGRWVRQFDPIPLGFLTGGVIDDRDRAALRRVARLAHRPDTPQPQRPGERRIRPVIPQGGDLVEQRGRPQVRVLAQPGRAVRQRTGRTRRHRPVRGPRPAASRRDRPGPFVGPCRHAGRSPRSTSPVFVARGCPRRPPV